MRLYESALKAKQLKTVECGKMKYLPTYLEKRCDFVYAFAAKPVV